MSQRLPNGFAELEDLVEEWALPTEYQCQQKRLSSSPHELSAVYKKIQPRLEEILDHVDEFPVGEIPFESYNLFCLAMILAEIAPHIELYGSNPGVPYAFEETRFVGGHIHDQF